MQSIKIDGIVATISDLHWGKSKDSELRSILLDSYLEQICIELREFGVKTILVLGDWFDNRNMIHVKTGNHYAYRRLKKMSKDFKIIMIPGNHDFHLKKHNGIEEKINSIEIFGEIDNVHVFTEPVELLFDGNKTGLLVPWDTLPSEPIKKYDYLFGHFEWQGARMAGTTTIETGISPEMLTSFAPTIFTGHIHIRNVYHYSKGVLYSIGNPLELDWGDTGNTKGVYVIDPSSGEIAFIENTTSPKHIEILYSRIENAKQYDMSEVTGNFIKLIVDKQHTPKHLVDSLININSYTPLRPAFSEFVVDTPTIKDIVGQISGEVCEHAKEIIKLPLRDQIQKYVDFLGSEFESRGVNRDRLKSIAIEFYDKHAEKGIVEDDEQA